MLTLSPSGVDSTNHRQLTAYARDSVNDSVTYVDNACLQNDDPDYDGDICVSMKTPFCHTNAS